MMTHDGTSVGLMTASAMTSIAADAPANPRISKGRRPILSIRNIASTVVSRLTVPTPTVASICVFALSKPAWLKISGA
ncbi:MAG: hypothetical protein QOE49_840 [Rhodospirillaceae bacterium]|nr:hypothetical protein [Rhodospirillaceae bacterium]MEA2806701.1 hypothetical protein [Rhodospirillaceae bacterium]